MFVVNLTISKDSLEEDVMTQFNDLLICLPRVFDANCNFALCTLYTCDYIRHIPIMSNTTHNAVKQLLDYNLLPGLLI